MVDLNFYWKKLKCLDTEKVEVQGDYNSPRTRSFVLLFARCDNSTFDGVCKPDEEITFWLQRKFIIIYLNQVRFSTREYKEENKVIREANIIWHPLNSQIREEVVYKVRLTELNLQDMVW